MAEGQSGEIEPVYLTLDDGLEPMLTFLEINGLRVEVSDPELADWILSFSAGATPEAVVKLVTSAMRGMP